MIKIFSVLDRRAIEGRYMMEINRVDARRPESDAAADRMSAARPGHHRSHFLVSAVYTLPAANEFGRLVSSLSRQSSPSSFCFLSLPRIILRLFAKKESFYGAFLFIYLFMMKDKETYHLQNSTENIIYCYLTITLEEKSTFTERA